MGKSGLNQVALARKINVSQTAVSKWISGSIPRGDQLLSIAEALGTSMEWLMRGGDTPPNPSTPPSPTPNPKAIRKALAEARDSLDRIENQLEP